MELGIHFSHELFSPSRLLRMAQEAEQAGFVHASCSDHFHPWSEKHSASGFAWSWLGSALQATRMSFGVVNAPGQRYHPAIIAQASATLAEMFPNRFWLALGSGEALNEHITSQLWLDKEARNVRLIESANIIRRLWAGDEVTYSGLVNVRKAKLYTLPQRPPLLLGAALSKETSAWIGTWADGLITAGDGDALKANVDNFKKSAGSGKPIYNQSAIVYAQSEDEALAFAEEHWRVATIPLTELAELELPREFDQKTTDVKPGELKEKLRLTGSADKIVEWLHSDSEAGIDRTYINFIGADWTSFLHLCKSRLVPAIT